MTNKEEILQLRINELIHTLLEADNLLSRLEDYTYGEDGKDITIIRGKILEILR